MTLRLTALLCSATLGLSACGGAKLVKHPETLHFERPLAAAIDDRLAATVDFVIVRNGRGAWAKNADWDEYLVRVRPVGDTPVRVIEATVVDSMGTRLQPLHERKALVSASKQTVKRYQHSGLKVKAGMGGAGLVATGIGAGLGSAGVAASGAGMMAGAAGAAAFMLVAPGFGVAGIARAVNNSKVNREIVRRHSSLPATASPQAEQAFDLFYPLAPSPSRLEITYADAQGQHRLDVDLRAALAGLHLGPAQASAATPPTSP